MISRPLREPQTSSAIPVCEADRPEPTGTRYEPTDYKVTFTNPDTAIMPHGTKGGDAQGSIIQTWFIQQ